MAFPRNRLKLLPQDLVDAKRRKATFREAAKTYTRFEEQLTDRPGAIAALMETAFNAGRQLSTSAEVADLAANDRAMIDIDVPALSRDVIEHLRRYRIGRGDRKRTIADFSFKLVYGEASAMGRKSADRWLDASDHIGRDRSTKAIGPLIKLGLFAEADIVSPDGETCRGISLTEWGLELILTGATSRPEDQIDGQSSTFGAYIAILEGRSIPKSHGTITFWDDPGHGTGMLLDHRVHGIGHPERLAGGRFAEDLGYSQEVGGLSPSHLIEIWRLCRPNPHILPLIPSDIPRLVKAGMLEEWAGGFLVLSEWAYELILTGETAAINNRRPGQSSTYQDYKKVLTRNAVK